jgi:hypothetical protein
MIKAKGTDPRTGRTILFLGLSFANLDKFKSAPRDTFIRVNGADVGVPIDIVILSGETEEKIAEAMIGPDTIIHDFKEYPRKR